MSITVGLDFGTHQTKICIEYGENPVQKRYEFFEFFDPEGSKTFMLPSVVQVNQDETVSFGFVDQSKIKTIINPPKKRPELVLPEKPILKELDKPKKASYPPRPEPIENQATDWKDQLSLLKNPNRRFYDENLQKWNRKVSKIDKLYRDECKTWEDVSTRRQDQYDLEFEKWNKKKSFLETEYQNQLSKWELTQTQKLHFKYFKLASFSRQAKLDWHLNIDPEIISVWYLTYILFVLREKLGEEIFIQMGIPSGLNLKEYQFQKENAFKMLIGAYQLVELFETKTTFLNQKWTDLYEYTEIPSKYTEEDLLINGLNVLPEAFAGLTSITQQGKLEQGMNLLVDIGGGTTDIAFFTISNELPDIHAVISFPQGLNFIMESVSKSNKIEEVYSLNNEFYLNTNDKKFEPGIIKYHEQLKEKAMHMKSQIKSSFLKRAEHHGMKMYKINDALLGRPVIYTGGGSINSRMRISLERFTDVKLISSNLLNIPFIVNKTINENLFPILANAYGLSIPMVDEIKITPITEAFNHLEMPSKPYDHDSDYGLADF